MTALLKPCVDCGVLSERPRCPEHATTGHKAPTTARGYDQAWRKLSERARKLQPFCTDCATTQDLTVDHSTEAWRRKQAGLPIRLQDITVVCRPCNSRRGQARPEGWGAGVTGGPPDPGGSQSLNHIPRGVTDGCN